jgi:uncharacterized protein (DUF362 family)
MAAAARCFGSPRSQVEDVAVAAASQDKTPRVGIVLSSFLGSKDHDGAVIQGLANPRPVDAGLSAAEIDGMLRKAIELGNTRRGGLLSIVKPDDWVVIKVDTRRCQCPGEGHVAGSVTDLRVVKSLIDWLVEHQRGSRITIADAPGNRQPAAPSTAVTDVWQTDWDGAFGGLSYRELVAGFSKHSTAKVDFIDLNVDEILELPVPGKPSASRNPDGLYHIPQTIQQCDRVISVAPLKTHPRTAVSLSIGNYFGIAPASRYGVSGSDLFKLGEPEEVLMDLFSFHTADYAILGGSWGMAGEGTEARGIHQNVLLAGVNAPAVDTVGAAVMGIAPSGIRHLNLAAKKGYGIVDLDLIWIRGNEIDEARGGFRRVTGAD